MNNGTKLTLGILGGLGAGLCLGLLMAPDKGSNNRKKIAETTSDWASRLKHLFSSDGHHKIISKKSSGRSAHKTNVNDISQAKRNHN